MTTKFKVGDKVRYETQTGLSEWDGLEGIVLEAKEFGTRVKTTKVGRIQGFVGHQYHLTTSRLALVEPAAKFKVGDVVTFVMEDFAPWQGGRGTVKSVNTGSLYAGGYGHYEVVVTEIPPANHAIREGHTAHFKAEWLKLVEEVKEAHPSNGKPASDVVNSPSHYTQYPVEVIELTRHMNFCRGNAVKYIARAGHKDPAKEIEDLKKAVWCIQDEIAQLEAVK